MTLRATRTVPGPNPSPSAPLTAGPTSPCVSTREPSAETQPWPWSIEDDAKVSDLHSGWGGCWDHSAHTESITGARMPGLCSSVSLCLLCEGRKTVKEHFPDLQTLLPVRSEGLSGQCLVCLWFCFKIETQCITAGPGIGIPNCWFTEVFCLICLKAREIFEITFKNWEVQQQ